MGRSGYKHLNEQERGRLAVGLGRGESPIARDLQRPACTLGHERQRNRHRDGYMGCVSPRARPRRAWRRLDVRASWRCG